MVNLLFKQLVKRLPEQPRSEIPLWLVGSLGPLLFLSICQITLKAQSSGMCPDSKIMLNILV